jgi:hypothetical protein
MEVSRAMASKVGNVTSLQSYGLLTSCLLQASHRNGSLTGHLFLPIQSTAARKITQVAAARYRTTILAASMSPLHGNTAGEHAITNYRCFVPNICQSRFAPHDTAHLIEIMGGNVR